MPDQVIAVSRLRAVRLAVGAFASALLFFSGVTPASAGDPTVACCHYDDGTYCTQDFLPLCLENGGFPSYEGNICGQVTCHCGNLAVDGGLGEQCDDGNTADGDGCDTNCTFTGCGNGIVTAPELCDDGNTNDFDGCTTNCVYPPPVGCGDGQLSDAEQCDDGNTASGDGCSEVCVNEFCGDGITNNNGEVCDDGNTADGDLCNSTCTATGPVCGDGITFCPVFRTAIVCEQCDDGNTTSGDGCSSICITEFCGDGIEQPGIGEQCDDGNSLNGDGCNNKCGDEFCGDGIEQPALGEQCDDGNTSDNDFCVGCSFAACGDGFLWSDNETPEECDDGNTVDGDGCSGLCVTEFCGDNIVQAGIGEECEDGNTNVFDSCVNCRDAVCGDGYLYLDSEVPEQCDDENTVSGDGCDANCVDEFCGDGIVNDDNGESMEECDDANTDDTDSCVTGCVAAACGDGIVNVSNGETLEQCDDGGTADGDGCDSTCTLETGACCYGSSCADDVLEADCALEFNGTFAGSGTTCEDPGVCVNCGDSQLQFGEECEDGNSAAGDGCDAGCAEEECWECTTTQVVPTGAILNPLPPSECDPIPASEEVPCDDGETCTLGDICDGGECVGDDPILPAACEWVMTGGDDTHKVQSRTRGNVIVHGDICGMTTRVGEVAEINGDVVATAVSGKGSQFGAAAAVVGDIITGGASINGRPKGVLLPGLATDVVPGGSSTVQTGAPTRDLDATGTSPLSLERVGDCQDAIDSMTPAIGMLDGLGPVDESLGKVKVTNNQSLTLTATDALHVVDMKSFVTGNKTQLILNGANIPGVTFVIRVEKKFYLRFQGDVVFQNGADPSRTIIYGKSLCKVGQEVIGGGTLFCPNNKLKMDIKTVWNGALLAGKKRIDLRHQCDLTHVPLLIAAP